MILSLFIIVTVVFTFEPISSWSFFFLKLLLLCSKVLSSNKVIKYLESKVFYHLSLLQFILSLSKISAFFSNNSLEIPVFFLPLPPKKRKKRKKHHCESLTIICFFFEHNSYFLRQL